MKAPLYRVAITAAVLAAPSTQALTPPSASDGPMKLLNCVVTTAGILQAEVYSSADETLSCDIRCDYELGERMFSHTFTESIPARFQGRVGRHDVTNARAGNYSGEIGNCQKILR